MVPNSNSYTGCALTMRNSPTRIWTPVLTSQKTHGISTLFHTKPKHPERNHQATANSHTVQGVLGHSMCPIGTRLKTVCTGKLQWMQELRSNFKSLQRRDSIHSMTGVIRWCGCFQVCLKIQKMILRWKSMVQRHCITQWRVRCMLSGLKTKNLNWMQCTRRYRLQSLGR